LKDDDDNDEVDSLQLPFRFTATN